MVWWSCHCTYTSIVYFHGTYYQVGCVLTDLESLQVISSIIAAWSDVANISTSASGLSSVTSAVATLNAGYFWMFGNCLTSAAYVSIFVCKREHLTYIIIFVGFGYAQENQSNRVF